MTTIFFKRNQVCSYSGWSQVQLSFCESGNKNQNMKTLLRCTYMNFFYDFRSTFETISGIFSHFTNSSSFSRCYLCAWTELSLNFKNHTKHPKKKKLFALLLSYMVWDPELKTSGNILQRKFVTPLFDEKWNPAKSAKLLMESIRIIVQYKWIVIRDVL